jgi:hypothetical protein
MAIVERRQGLGISAVGQGDQVLVCQKQVLSLFAGFSNHLVAPDARGINPSGRTIVGFEAIPEAMPSEAGYHC